ncbi:hypothetical protein D3C71_2077060 [compost metagenome]
MAGALGLLALQQLMLACDRQVRQGRTTGDARCIHGLQDSGKRTGMLLCMRNLARQRGKQCSFAFMGCARLQRVIEGTHGKSCE